MPLRVLYEQSEKKFTSKINCFFTELLFHCSLCFVYINMDKRKLLKLFWNCGDNQIIEFAIMRARLNKTEKETLNLMLDECMTQEQAAEALDCSVRKVQEDWSTAASKLLSISWVYAYAKSLDK